MRWAHLQNATTGAVYSRSIMGGFGQRLDQPGQGRSNRLGPDGSPITSQIKPTGPDPVVPTRWQGQAEPDRPDFLAVLTVRARHPSRGQAHVGATTPSRSQRHLLGHPFVDHPVAGNEFGINSGQGDLQVGGIGDQATAESGR